MRPLWTNPAKLREYRNTRLYRPLARTLRVYNRRMVDGLHARGFTDFSPGFPSLLSNLDVEGTRIGVLAKRAGVTRQAAGQLLREIETCGYVERRRAADDARATVVRFTGRGRRLLAAVFELVEEIEEEFSGVLAPGEFDQLRDTLLRLANRIDPVGAFGASDEPPRRSASVTLTGQSGVMKIPKSNRTTDRHQTRSRGRCAASYRSVLLLTSFSFRTVHSSRPACGDWVDPYFINFLLEHWHHSVWTLERSLPRRRCTSRGDRHAGLLARADSLRPLSTWSRGSSPIRCRPYTAALFLVVEIGSLCLYAPACGTLVPPRIRRVARE